MKKKNFFILFCLISIWVFSSCWAPRCPMDTCRVRHEHQHNDLVTGVFSGRYHYPTRLHFIWDKNKGQKIEDKGTVPKGPKRKMRKKFPWERW